jgi:hypothetical protein
MGYTIEKVDCRWPYNFRSVPVLRSEQCSYPLVYTNTLLYALLIYMYLLVT